MMATKVAPMLAITGVGAISPVGRSAVETCASVRADICRFCEWPWYVPLTSDPEWEKGEPLIASFVPDVTARAPGPIRLVELATLALRDLVSRARVAADGSGPGRALFGAARAGCRLWEVGAGSRVGPPDLRARRSAGDSGR
jgi:hypothetical protein